MHSSPSPQGSMPPRTFRNALLAVVAVALMLAAPSIHGQACGANRIALIIPCHRVVGSAGALGGFMNAERGDPLAIKRWLLAHEGYRFGA